MPAYYNELDPYAAQWLRNLIAAGHIAPGDVDERSVLNVRADDLVGYTQCHFFAGIGVWSYALRLAGWPDERACWTGSCPCQPFSTAGKRAGFQDERHLWPAWARLIAEQRPRAIFGEQVADGDGLAWLDAVQADLEARHYAVGAVVLPAAGIGAPHGRHRIFFVADAGRQRDERGRGSRDAHGAAGEVEGEGHQRQRRGAYAGDRGAVRDMANADPRGRRAGEPDAPPRGEQPQPAGRGDAGVLANASGGGGSHERLRAGASGQHVGAVVGASGRGGDGDGAARSVDPVGGRAGQAGILADAAGLADHESRGHEFQRGRTRDPEHARMGGDALLVGDAVGPRLEVGPLAPDERGVIRLQGAALGATGALHGPWADADWLYCTDGKWRPVEPGTQPLAARTPKRLERLRAYGNAINAEVAAAFIRAFMDSHEGG